MKRKTNTTYKRQPKVAITFSETLDKSIASARESLGKAISDVTVLRLVSYCK